MSTPIGLLLSEELLKELDALFPDQCPHYTTPMNEIMYRSGERNVVDVLWERYREAQENILR